MPRGVAITGMGIVSSIGLSVEENFQSLIERKTGISRLANFSSKHADHIKVGEIKHTDQELSQFLGLGSAHSFTRTSLLGALAAKQALNDAGITDINAERTGLLSATSVAGMDYTEKYFQHFATDPELRKYRNSHPAGDSSNKRASYLGLQGLVSTISTACSSAANALMLGARLIEQGKLDRVLVGGTDALSKFTINGFQSLMILSDSDCQPFDQHRKGLNLGEAAAYLLLESDTLLAKQPKKVHAYLSGYGNANDAYHQTASSETGEGAYLAMKKALEKADLAPTAIDYINAHGTATGNNDLSEGHALLRCFQQYQPSAPRSPILGIRLQQQVPLKPSIVYWPSSRAAYFRPSTFNIKWKNSTCNRKLNYNPKPSITCFPTPLALVAIAHLFYFQKPDENCYINGIGTIGIQHPDYKLLEQEPQVLFTRNQAQHPVYKELIPAASLRRMATGVKMGCYAAQLALQEAQQPALDAIICGTGQGCLQDSEKFLTAMIAQDEEYLTPTSFIQSTHNTVAAQIALQLQCHAYNFTYVQGGSSFESALLMG